MRIRYTIPVERPLKVRNHWRFAWLGGEFRLLEEEGLVTGVQVAFQEQPTALAPVIVHHPDGETKATITGRDTLLPLVQRRLRRGLAYLQCQFQLELALDRMKSEYEPENDAERDEIQMYGFSRGGDPPPLNLTFDLFTRAMMAPEGDDDPELTAGFVMAARRALFEGSYISSFRYAFLLFDTLFGEGQFRSKALKARFKASPRFCAAVADALMATRFRQSAGGEDTKGLLRPGASLDAVIDHLVDKRGFYFHGQGRHPRAWRPDQQKEAETLAELAVGIAQSLGAEAAKPMFAPDLAQQHFDSAKRAGAVIMLTIDYRFREPEEGFDRPGRVVFNVPGPNPTGAMAAEVAREFLHRFTQDAPQAALREARCTGPNGQEVFTFKVLVD